MSSLQGQFLIASPRMGDPTFEQTVVLMVNHNDEGAMGVVVNRKLDVSLHDAWEHVSEAPCSLNTHLYAGGPCEGVLMAVHTHASIAQETITDGLYFSTERPYLEWLVDQDHEDTRARFFAGYAGWGPGQLEHELRLNSWLVTPCHPDLVFGPCDQLWLQMLAQVDPAMARIAMNPVLLPPDPSMN